MRIEVLLFAQLRDAFGKEIVMVDVDEGKTAAQLGTELLSSRTDRGLASLPVRYAVDATFVDDDYQLRDGERLAIIPPVSGG
jgi:molybdopterin converting factor small subunit